MANEILAIEVPDKTCPAVGYQAVSVCVPVTVTPFAHAGATSTKCCGEPVITSGRKTCDGMKNGTCSFTISQKLSVAVPVVFGAVAHVGDTYVDCHGASDRENCYEESSVGGDI